MEDYLYTHLKNLATGNTEAEEFARLSSKTVWKAIDLLFPSLEDVSKRKKVYNYIQKKFVANHCCALYTISKDFSRLCVSLDLNPGSREVIITSGGSILYAPSFTSAPVPIS